MDKVTPVLESAANTTDVEFCADRQVPGSDEDVGLLGTHGARIVYGRWFDRQEFASVDLATTVVETARQLKPLFDEMLALAS